MTNNIDNYIKEINRLMKYDRSKTIIEQEGAPVEPKTDVEVGDISSTVIPNDVEVSGYGENSFVIKDFSGSEFGYPENCNSEFVLEGDETKPAIEGYCIYKGFGDKKIYINEKDKVWFISGSYTELYDMWNDLVEKYPSIDEWSDEKQNEFYDFLKKGYEFGTVRQIKSNNQNYIARYKFNNGFWGFSGLFNKGGQSYNEPKVTRVEDGWEIYRHELTQNYLEPYVFENIDSLASFLCGDDSPFAGLFTIPWLEYKSEELFCDILAGVLMAISPTGAVVGLSIEILHAKDLYNKGDKLGALISLTIGLLPVIGDGLGKILKGLIGKIGPKGISSVVRVITLIVKFLSGQVKASKLISAMKTLSTDERKMLYYLWSTSSELTSKAKRLSSEFDDIYKRLNSLGYGGELISDSVKLISEILNESSILKNFGDLVAQTGTIMTTIFGLHFVESITSDPNNESFEAFDNQIEEMNKKLEELGNKGFDDLYESDLELYNVE